MDNKGEGQVITIQDVDDSWKRLKKGLTKVKLPLKKHMQNSEDVEILETFITGQIARIIQADQQAKQAKQAQLGRRFPPAKNIQEAVRASAANGGAAVEVAQDDVPAAPMGSPQLSKVAEPETKADAPSGG